MAKIEFKVLSRYASNVIKGTSYNSRASVINTLLKDGTILNRAPMAIEEEDSVVYNHTLRMREPHPDPTKQGMFIYTETFSYLTEEDEHNIQDKYEKQKNALIRAFHDFLKIHDHVIVRDRNGNDTNRNNLHHAFELIDITQNIQVEAQMNKQKIEAGSVLTNLFNSDIKSFRDFCYAYGLPSIDLFDDSKLFNLAMMKMNDNPDFFFSIYNNKQRDIMTLIQIALNKNIGTPEMPKTALTQNGETFYLDGGDILAIGMHAVQEALMTDVYKRRILETLVGYNVTVAKPIESIEVEAIDFKHLEKKASQSGFKGSETETKLQKTVRAKCVGLSSVKSKEKFEDKVSELKTLFNTDEFMPVYTYAIQYLDDFIARNYRFERNKDRVILEDDPTNVDNESFNN
jgi:hypothetical protein